MQKIDDVSTLVFTKARGGKFRWLTISTLMLAIGMLLAAFPYGNFFSEFGGALVAGFFAHSVPALRIGKFSLRPILTGFVTTLVSGFIFVTILKVVVGIPMPGYLYGILPAVAMVAAGNFPDNEWRGCSR